MRHLRRYLIAVTVAVLALTAPAQATQAPPTLPAPSGPFPVGYERLYLVDRTRIDPWVPSAGARELMLSLWYPAAAAVGKPAEYLTLAEARAMLELHQVSVDPALIAGVRGAGRASAPIRPRPGGYPLVVLSPGFSFTVATMTSVAQDLASRGYVVAGIDHPYESAGLELPGGRLATCVACETATPVQIPPVRARDISFVLDRLLAPGRGPWRGARWIDQTRIGVAGHSIGGNSALETMRSDLRIDAGANFDGTFFTLPPADGIDRPFLMLGTPRHTPGGDDPSWDKTWPLLTGPRHWLTADGTGHVSFTDFPVLSKRLGLPADPEAPLDADRTDQLTRGLTRDFFDHYLRGRPSTPLLDATDPRYPELHRH